MYRNHEESSKIKWVLFCKSIHHLPSHILIYSQQACIQLLEGADKVIHGISKSADFTAVQKGRSFVKHPSIRLYNSIWIGVASSDVFTAADIQIQKTIEYNLR